MTVSVHNTIIAFALGGLLIGSASEVLAQPAIVVDIEPPAPQVEVVPPVPFFGAVWVGGHWAWHDGRHHWIAGRYIHPRAGYVYVPHVWTRHGARWRFAPGHWRHH